MFLLCSFLLYFCKTKIKLLIWKSDKFGLIFVITVSDLVKGCKAVVMYPQHREIETFEVKV
jgi:hypothetical protein